MIQILESQPKEQSRLISLRDKLHRTLKEMAQLNTQNQALIKQSLEMVEFDLTLFKSLRQHRKRQIITNLHTIPEIC